MSDSSVDPLFLAPNRFVDSDHPDVVAYARTHGTGDTPTERAISLYYAVRDGFRYDPWTVATTPDGYRASQVLSRSPAKGHCIDKALVLAAACRALGIPSRLHYANVRNHIGTARLEELLGTNLLVYHGYNELYLDGDWVAATPAFNRALCEHLGVAPLEFDGVTDSVFQAYDADQGQFMEYVADHGSHAGLPFDAMLAEWKRHYPKFADAWGTSL